METKKTCLSNTFMETYDIIHSIPYRSISNLEKNYPSLLERYYMTIKEVTKQAMYSSKQFTTQNKDENGDPITFSNIDMVTSLRKHGEKSHFTTTICDGLDATGQKQYCTIESDEILDEIYSHILIQDTQKGYYINSNNSRHAYHRICLTVRNCLVDMIRKMEKNKPLTEGISLNAPIPHEEDESLAFQKVDEKVHLEDDVVNTLYIKYVKNVIIHKKIEILKKHPDRLIAYLNNVADRDSRTLLTDIHNYGYQKALTNIISALNDIDINVNYLIKNNFVYKINNTDVTAQNIYGWLSRSFDDLNK